MPDIRARHLAAVVLGSLMLSGCATQLVDRPLSTSQQETPVGHEYISGAQFRFSLGKEQVIPEEFLEPTVKITHMTGQSDERPVWLRFTGESVEVLYRALSEPEKLRFTFYPKRFDARRKIFLQPIPSVEVALRDGEVVPVSVVLTRDEEVERELKRLEKLGYQGSWLELMERFESGDKSAEKEGS